MLSTKSSVFSNILIVVKRTFLLYKYRFSKGNLILLAFSILIMALIVKLNIELLYHATAFEPHACITLIMLMGSEITNDVMVYGFY